MKSKKIREATDDNFENDVTRSTKPVVVEFWAPWCGPCKLVSPIVEKLAEKYGSSVKFFSVNVDENRKKPAEYAIRSIPALLFFKDGSVRNQLIGVQSEQKIEEAVRELL